MVCKNYKCKRCTKISTAGQWNLHTEAYAKENKLKFNVKLQYSGGRKSLTYVCPFCHVISSSCDIAPVPRLEESNAFVGFM